MNDRRAYQIIDWILALCIVAILAIAAYYAIHRRDIWVGLAIAAILVLDKILKAIINLANSK